MPQQSFDPGLTQQYTGNLRRTINRDGTFNVHRRGAGLKNANLYLFLVSIPWLGFVACVLGAYLIVNCVFACLYFLIGVQSLNGADVSTPERAFLSAFFFSSHTLTTVGYGNLYPKTLVANGLAAIEALFGLLGFAVATGLMYGRVSRPSARIAFSESLLVAPYQQGQSLQFRIANQRDNILIDIDARVLLMTVDQTEGTAKRNYAPLTLERPSIYFLPLTWTVVHAIDEQSPVKGLSVADLERMQAEFLVLVKAFDDTFSQTVHARYSYRWDELVWNARFQPAFSIDRQGDLVVELDQISSFQPVPEQPVS